MAAHLHPGDPRRAAAGVGALTAVIGAVLLAAPARVGRRAWITDPAHARLLGAVDLALVPGLLAGRPRAPWMAARVIANLGTAAWYGRIARTMPGHRGPRVVVAALLALSVVDLQVVAALHRDERG